MDEQKLITAEKTQRERDPYLFSGWRFTAMIVVIILSAVGYLLFSIWGGWREVLSAVSKVGVGGIAFALTLSLVNYTLRFVRWQHYLNLLGFQVPWLQSFRIYIAGFSLTATPGKAGEALRSVFLKGYGVTYRRSIGALISERFSDLIAVSLIAAGGLWVFPQARPAVIAVAVVIAFVFFMIQKNAWLRAIERFADKYLPSRFSSGVDFFIDTVLAFRSCFNFWALVYGIGLGVLAWGAEASAFWMILRLLGYDIQCLTAFFIYAFSLLVGAVTFLPGGLGGTEVAMIELLHLSGVPFSDAIAATLVIRIATLWFSIFLGVAALPKSDRA